MGAWRLSMAKEDKESEKIKIGIKRTEAALPPPMPLTAGLTADDEDTAKSRSMIVKHMLEFPLDRLFSWSRWSEREVPLMASILTRQAALNPKVRPMDEHGNPKRLAIIHLENIAWLRLAVKGALRTEAKDMYQLEVQKAQAGDEGWGSNLK